MFVVAFSFLRRIFIYMFSLMNEKVIINFFITVKCIVSLELDEIKNKKEEIKLLILYLLLKIIFKCHYQFAVKLK